MSDTFAEASAENGLAIAHVKDATASAEEAGYNAIAAGMVWNRQKKLVGHGNWDRYWDQNYKKEVDVSVRTRQRWMREAAKATKLGHSTKNDIVSYLRQAGALGIESNEPKKKSSSTKLVESTSSKQEQQGTDGQHSTEADDGKAATEQSGAGAIEDSDSTVCVDSPAPPTLDAAVPGDDKEGTLPARSSDGGGVQPYRSVPPGDIEEPLYGPEELREMVTAFEPSTVQTWLVEAVPASQRVVLLATVENLCGSGASETPAPRKRGGFQPPTVAEVAADFPTIDSQEFCDYYSAQGWKLSNGNAMKDWRAAARRWAKQNNGKPSDPQGMVYTGPEPKRVQK